MEIIEQGVAFPVHKKRGPAPNPIWDQLSVGDSFRTEYKSITVGRTRSREVSIRLAPKRFVARAMPDHIRVWRVK